MDSNDSNKFVEYDTTDTEYFGAQAVVKKEQEYIRQRRNLAADAKIENLSGLALSGGGIRSASFSLGVMQALAHNGWLKKFDYLSTVSGGGYAGSSLSWLLSQKIDKAENGIARFGVSREDFPYGVYPMSGARPEKRLTPNGDTEETKRLEPDHTSERYKGKLLRYLRQQAKYLTPGNGINALSLVAVLLRGALLSLFVYFGLLVLAFVLLYPALCTTTEACTNAYKVLGISLPLVDLNFALWAAFALSGVFALGAVAYSLFAYLSSKHKTTRGKAQLENASKSWGYTLRQCYERIAGSLLGIILALLILGAVPEIYELLQHSLNPDPANISNFEISGTHADDGVLQITGTVQKPTPKETDSDISTALLGLFSTLFGALSGVLAFFKSGSGKKGRLPMGLIVAVGTAALWFGLLLIAYFIADWLWDNKDGNTLLSWWISAAIAITLIGRWANINYLSIHRYYRDRLMEAFMPDIDRALGGKLATEAVTRADKTPIQSLFDENNGNGLAANPAPYHLINTNVILESSTIPKFRGRGGDNFILSPYFCGSNATDWATSESFMEGRMTLPTAMAISGAAVNPSTGVGGQGATRQPLLSMFMGLLNIRLGYWTPNPNPTRASKAIPNYFRPGLSAMLPWTRMHEKAPYVQLTDGGHFENLALYELIRRRTRFIIVCDGAADPDFQFTDFANAQEKIRSDFGTLICCDCNDLQKLVPRAKKDDDCCANEGAMEYADRGYLLSKIIYPDNSQGRLLYIKTTFFEKLSADLFGYKKSHPQFPDEPTSDQFFDEKQFEAYRELGFQTAWEMMHDDELTKDEFVEAFLQPATP